MKRYITPEELEQLVQFAEDDRIEIDPTLIEALNTLHSAVMRNTVRHLTGARKRNALLKDRLDRYAEREKTRIDEEGFTETDMPSEMVAMGILYHLQTKSSYKITSTKLNFILYELYSSWLLTKKKRLCEEHPVWTPYGPRFWSVWTKVNPTVPVPYEKYRELTQASPAIAAACEDIAEKYFDKSANILEDRFKKSKAYKNASSEKNDGKWNKVITDQDIYAWRESIKP